MSGNGSSYYALMTDDSKRVTLEFTFVDLGSPKVHDVLFELTQISAFENGREMRATDARNSCHLDLFVSKEEHGLVRLQSGSDMMVLSAQPRDYSRQMRQDIARIAVLQRPYRGRVFRTDIPFIGKCKR